jgi:hypothetical protein
MFKVQHPALVEQQSQGIKKKMNTEFFSFIYLSTLLEKKNNITIHW